VTNLGWPGGLSLSAMDVPMKHLAFERLAFRVRWAGQNYREWRSLPCPMSCSRRVGVVADLKSPTTPFVLAVSLKL
jgi:hypothetical protein